jgi:hypothetical protein
LSEICASENQEEGIEQNSFFRQSVDAQDGKDDCACHAIALAVEDAIKEFDGDDLITKVSFILVVHLLSLA